MFLLYNAFHNESVNKINRCDRWALGPVVLALAGLVLAANLECALAGGPPLPILQARSLPAGGVSLALTAPGTNTLWQLQFSTDLQNWTTLRDWTQPAGPAGEPLEWLDPVAPSPARFYRALTVLTNWDAPVRLWGVAAVVDPLVGATVTVEDLNGNVLAAQVGATSDSGMFDFMVPALPSAFQVIVQYGTSDEAPFTGTLKRTVVNYDRQSFLVVNPVSTLIAAYQDRHPGLALAQAQAEVTQYLMAPAGEELVEDLSYGDYQYFDPQFYLGQANGAGGFDAFTAQVAGSILPGASRSFAPDNGFVFDAIKEFATWGFKQIASGAVGAVGAKGANSLFGLIFGSEQAETMGALMDISNRISQVQQQLGNVYTTVVQIQQNLNNVSAELHLMQWDEAIGRIYDPVTSVESTFKQFWLKAQDAQLNPTNASIANYATTMTSDGGPILNSTTGIYKDMDLLNNNILGLLGGTPLLEIRVTNLESNVEVDLTHRDAAYQALRDFFAQLLGVQAKGLNLIVQAYDGQGATNTANNYLAGFYTNNLAPQVRLFEQTIEEVVLRYYDSRWAEFLPETNSSVMLAPAYQFADSLLNSYRISLQNGRTVLAGTNAVTMLTVAIAYVGAPPSVDSVTLTDTNSGQTIVVPYEATTAVATDGGQLSLLRFHAENVPSGTYQLLKVGSNLAAGCISSIYTSEQVTIDANDMNKLYGTLCIPAWAPLASQFGSPAVQCYKMSAQYSGKALEFAGASRVEGARVQQWDKSSFDNQKWQWKWGDYGHFYWVNKYSGQYLTGDYNSFDTVFISQHAWQSAGVGTEGVPSQEWGKVTGWTDNAWAIYASTSRALSIDGHSSMNGAFAVQENYPHQTWGLQDIGDCGWWREEDAGNGYTYLKNQTTGKYLEVAGPSTETEAHLQAVTWNGGNNQKWVFVYAGNGYYVLANFYANMVADLWAGNSADGAEIKSNQWYGRSAANPDNQLWRIDVLGDGSCRILSKAVGKGVAVENASSQDGARVCSWSWTSTQSNARWLLTPTN